MAPSGLLWQVDANGNGRPSGTGLPVAGGTSPSIAAGSGTEWEIAYQSNNGLPQPPRTNASPPPASRT